MSNNLNTGNKNKDNQVSSNFNVDINSYCAEDDDNEDEGEAVDMDAFVESGLLEDDSVIFCLIQIFNSFFHVCCNSIILVCIN